LPSPLADVSQAGNIARARHITARQGILFTFCPPVFRPLAFWPAGVRNGTCYSR
jgi:hypothetical protein